MDSPKLPEPDGWIGASDLDPDAGVEGWSREAMLSMYRQGMESTRQHLSADDLYTLIGYAVGLRAEGKADMPVYFEELAERIAKALGDEDLIKRTSAIRLEAQGGSHG